MRQRPYLLFYQMVSCVVHLLFLTYGGAIVQSILGLVYECKSTSKMKVWVDSQG